MSNQAKNDKYGDNAICPVCKTGFHSNDGDRYCSEECFWHHAYDECEEYVDDTPTD